jgi:agmatine deiminase
MKKHLLLFTALCFIFKMNAQQDLPKDFAPGEKEKMEEYLNNIRNSQQKSLFVTPPPYTKLRNAAEWEEISTLNITWTGSFTSHHRDIIKAAQLECVVTIICTDSNNVKSNLTTNSVPLTNLKFIQVGYNSIWARDYSGNSVYGAYVDSLILVDWVYNRPRPLDDVTPTSIAGLWGIPIYETKQAPNDLIHTGGNYMSDGFGTAFSSNLVVTENPSKTVAQIDTIMKKFMGINRYIKMTILPYDGIHHIDMHMKLMDEETLLWGQYPTGVSDGPQIEANLQFIQSNYNSVYGTPYKVVRIPMPMDKNNKWPNQSGGWYCTYTNGVFVNKTYIFPSYYQQYDTTAIRILKENLPGYNIVPIDVDNGTSPLISQSGAIHCITHAVHVKDPLLISHQKIAQGCDTDPSYQVKAKIMHRTGINTAFVYWTIDTLLGFNPVAMTLTNASTNEWTGNIPPQVAGKTVYYYIEANAVSGKTMRRPITAPLGRNIFKTISCPISNIKENNGFEFKPAYPNPANAITCIPLSSSKNQAIKVSLYNVMGQLVDVIYEGEINQGDKNVFLFADRYAKGVYLLEAKTENSVKTQKLIIK